VVSSLGVVDVVRRERIWDFLFLFRRSNKLLRGDFLEPERNGNLFRAGEERILEEEDFGGLDLGEEGLGRALLIVLGVWEMVLDKGWGVVTLTESKEIFDLTLSVEFFSTEGLGLNRLDRF